MSSRRSWARVPATRRGHGPSLTLPDRDHCPLLHPRQASPTSGHHREALFRCRPREASSHRRNPLLPVGWRRENGIRPCPRPVSHPSREPSVGLTPRRLRARATSRTSRSSRRRPLRRPLRHFQPPPLPLPRHDKPPPSVRRPRRDLLRRRPSRSPTTTPRL